MKTTGKKILYNVLQLVFYGVIPLVLILLNYGNMGHTKEAVGFKIAAPGIIVLLLVFLCFKKLFINKKLADAHAQLNQLKADLRVETDKQKVKNVEREVKNLATVEVVLNAVTPLLLMTLLILCCQVMEAQLIKLSGTCGFILMSFLLGTAFAVLDAREVKSKNKEVDSSVKT